MNHLPFKGNLDLIQLMLNAHNLEENPEEVDNEIGGTMDKLVSKRGVNILTYITLFFNLPIC